MQLDDSATRTVGVSIVTTEKGIKLISIIIIIHQLRLFACPAWRESRNSRAAPAESPIASRNTASVSMQGCCAWNIANVWIATTQRRWSTNTF